MPGVIADRTRTEPKTEMLDLMKVHREEYQASREPILVETKPAHYLTIYGSGEPGPESFQPKFAALYTLAYALKFLNKGLGRDFKVGMPEGLFWGSGMERKFLTEAPLTWQWMLCIRVPNFVTAEQLRGVAEGVGKRKLALPIREVRLKSLTEGPCVQILHVGAYDAELPTLLRLQEFAEAMGRQANGPHHEIYLNAPGRVGPERLRTIIRQPVRPARPSAP